MPISIFIHAFLSTLSLRRATLHCKTLNTFLHYFYPRSPCGERPNYVVTRGNDYVFLSTLSLRRATTDMRQRLIEFRFLSTLSLRRATTLIWDVIAVMTISIHALLAESDEHAYQLVLWVLRFLSTLSLRRATANTRAERQERHISIHALLAESDSSFCILWC